MTRRALKTSPMALIVALCCFVMACKSPATGLVADSGQDSAMSGPPTMNATYGARNARVCAKVKAPPTAEQARALVQCSLERIDMGPSLLLVTDVQIEMGAVRDPTPMDRMNDSDPTAKIYPLRGSLTHYSCAPLADFPNGGNCTRWAAAVGGNAPGKCWKNSFGEWQCTLSGGSVNSFDPKRMAGPTTY